MKKKKKKSEYNSDSAVSRFHSFVHSFIRSFLHSFIRSFLHSFVRSFVHSFTHPSIGRSATLSVSQSSQSLSPNPLARDMTVKTTATRPASVRVYLESSGFVPTNLIGHKWRTTLQRRTALRYKSPLSQRWRHPQANRDDL